MSIGAEIIVEAGHSESRLHSPDFSGLEDGDLHVWWVNLTPAGAPEARGQQYLTADESDRATRFKFAQDRIRFLNRRVALRQLLGAYLSIPPAEIGFVSGRGGKPEATGQGSPAGLRFSCSHSSDLALIAFARDRELGVDLEQRRPLPEALELARSFFAPLERAALESVPAAQRETAFFDCWTRKEAFVKALGVGLSFPLDRFTVSLGPDQPAALLQVEDDPSAVARWRMQSLDFGPSHSATLVYEGADACIQSSEWKHDLA